MKPSQGFPISCLLCCYPFLARYLTTSNAIETMFFLVGCAEAIHGFPSLLWSLLLACVTLHGGMLDALLMLSGSSRRSRERSVGTIGGLGGQEIALPVAIVLLAADGLQASCWSWAASPGWRES